MNWEAFGAIAEAIGAVAVVATLVYLARQVQSARHEQQAASIRANRNERRQYFELVRDSAYLPAILCKLDAAEPLTPEDEKRLLAHNAATWGLIYSEWVQGQLGLFGEYATSVEFNVTLLAADSRNLVWFDRHGRKIYPARFVSEVERILPNLKTG